jgi:uncharacterized repeat protein (TIGR03843 family)
MSEQPLEPDLRPPVDDDEALRLLREGVIDLEGRMLDASNVTLVGSIRTADLAAECVYKPVAGERPLWDFPDGTLAGREISAFLVSEATGWGVVPPTVLRVDAPLGEGSLQWFVNADFREHYFSLYAERSELHDQLQAIAVFDVIANNTDRKSGHCLLEIDSAGGGDRVWAIDNGLCFSADDKLRTVIWEFAGERLPDDLRRAAASAVDAAAGLATLLDDDEIAAVCRRAQRLARTSTFPVERHSHGYPWPLV